MWTYFHEIFRTGRPWHKEHFGTYPNLESRAWIVQYCFYVHCANTISFARGHLSCKCVWDPGSRLRLLNCKLLGFGGGIHSVIALPFGHDFGLLLDML